MSYPVTFDITAPQRFKKEHVAIRILAVIVLWMLGALISWLFGAVYLVLPIAAAILISQKGAEQYLAESEQEVSKWTRYAIALYAYLGFLTDRFINEEPKETFRFTVQPSGQPTPGSALLRVITGIPHAVVLSILAIAFIVVLPVSAVSILINETVPAWAYSFTRGWLRWNTRLLAYMASLVDEYPPFSFGEDEPAPAPAAPQPTGDTPAAHPPA